MRDWVVKYYVNKETDVHYEHIVVEPSTVDDCYFAIQFTQFEKRWKQINMDMHSLLQ